MKTEADVQAAFQKRMTILIKSHFALIQNTEKTIASKWGGKTGVFSNHKQFMY